LVPVNWRYSYKDDLGYGIGNQLRAIFDFGIVDKRPFKNKIEAFKWLDLPSDYKIPDS